MQNNNSLGYKKEICFDFDGVIHSYYSGWVSVDLALDEPVPGIKECIDKLKKKYNIVIYSSRCSHPDGIKCIEEYCKEFNIYYDKVADKKPPAYITIDDRCICFDGNSISSLIDKIENFIPWNKKDENKLKTLSNFDNINTNSSEGKMLVAAISILTTNKFNYKENIINGSKQHPNDIYDIVKDLSKDIFNKKL